MNALFHNHRKPIPDEVREATRPIMMNTLSHATVMEIDVYEFDGAGSRILAGNKDRLVILSNHPGIEDVTGFDVKYFEYEGLRVAQYIQKEGRTNQLAIYPDLFDSVDDAKLELLTNIMKQLNDVFYQAVLDYSWKSTTKKDMLTREFTEQIRQQQSRYLDEDKDNLITSERKVREYMKLIKEYTDRITRFRINIESAEARLGAVGEKLIKDLDNIVAHPKVKEMFIRDGKFTVETTPIYAYHDKTGERYYIGNMRIEMNPNNTQVKFFGDNPRRSYWSTSDPHPHVDGRSGSACLGNISGTIAELCSQMEIYALTMVCIDFLESVNTSDPAGANISNWDMVDEEGNIIERGDDPENDWHCDYCEEGFNDTDDSYTVYDSYTGDADGHGDWGAERTVCEHCCMEEYSWHEDLNEYVRDGHCDIDAEEEEEDGEIEL